MKCAVWLFPHVRWSDGGAGVGLGCRFRRDQRCGEPAFFLRVGKLPGLSSCSSGGARVPEGRIFRPVGVLSSCDNLAGLDCSLARQLPVLLRTRCPPLVGVSSRACPVAPQALGQNSDSNSNYGIFEVFMKQPSSTLTGELKAPPLEMQHLATRYHKHVQLRDLFKCAAMKADTFALLQLTGSFFGLSGPDATQLSPEQRHQQAWKPSIPVVCVGTLLRAVMMKFFRYLLWIEVRPLPHSRISECPLKVRFITPSPKKGGKLKKDKKLKK